MRAQSDIQELTRATWKPLEGGSQVVPPGAGRKKVRGLKSSRFPALCAGSQVTLLSLRASVHQLNGAE